MKKARRFLRGAGCLLLAAVMLLSAACAKTPAETADNFEPILRFVVTSDVHIRSAADNYESYDRLTALYKTAYAYCDAQTSYNKLDGIFFVGDITDNGTAEQYTYFFDYVKENTRADTATRAVIGNHEFYDTGKYTATSMKNAPLRFLEYSGYDTIDTHTVIGGYHFIFMGMDLYNYTRNTYFSEKKLGWLKKELDAAVAEDPNKPVFLFQHEPAANTVVGSYGQNGDNALRALLDEYPQVIDFSGHSHRPLTNPRSVWQGTFTAVNTGSLAYLSVPVPDRVDYEDGGVVAADKNGNWTSGANGERNGVMYYIVEVDKNHTVRLLTYNLLTESLWGEPFVFDSLDPQEFKYTDARKETAEKPTFGNGAALKLESVNTKTATITLPQASCKDVVQSYRIEVYDSNGLKYRKFLLAGTYYGAAAPASQTFEVINLKPSAEYTVAVYAVCAWAVESDPLVLEFTTPDAG